MDGQLQQDLLRLVVVGSVDDGKSTLIGRLLYEADGLAEDAISQVKRASRPAGAIDFSLFTDGLKAEREQGITIDVAYRSFATPRRRFIVADTPGHVQYTRNMATGASTASAAVILIDARLKVLPQSRRHAYLASLLGIRQLTVAVNKMDLVAWSQATFDEIRAELLAFTRSLRFDAVTFVPISATEGENVVQRSAHMPWYQGPSMLEHLERLPVDSRHGEGPMRFPVQHVLRPDLSYRGFAGQLASGTVRVGDPVVVLPSGQRTTVAGIDTFEGSRPSAHAPMSVRLRLSDEVDVSRGDVLAPVGSPPAVKKELDASLVWLSERPLDPQREYLIKHTSRVVPARLEQVLFRLDLDSLAPVPAQALGLNDVGRVRVRCARPLCVDPYARVRATGAFIVIDALTNDTVAAGMVEEGEGAAAAPRITSSVGAEARAARLGHPGALVFLGADRARAYSLEAELFEAGALVTVASTAEAAVACARGGLLCLVAAEGDELGRSRLQAELRASGRPYLEAAARLTAAEVLSAVRALRAE